MNWEAIGAIGEIVGAVAVLLTIFYLALQIRQNTRQITIGIEATRLAAFERNIASGNRLREFFLVHPDLFELYNKGGKSYIALDELEKQKFGLMIRNVFSEVQGAYIRQCSIAHDPKGVVGLAQVVDEFVSAKGVQEFLQSAKPDWRPEFQQFVEERLEVLTGAK